MAVVVLIIVRYWERLPLHSIGFRRLTMKEVWLALVLSILLFALTPALAIFVERVFRIPTWTRIMVMAQHFAKVPIWKLSRND